jgi:hypothetical protein
MSPKFFFHKMREVASFLKIMRGKATGNKKDRLEGVDDALNAMKNEKKFYLDENQQPQSGQDKVLRESGGQDISAI